MQKGRQKKTKETPESPHQELLRHMKECASILENKIDSVEGSLRSEMNLQVGSLRSEMNKRFDEVDKRFEKVDQRFDEVATNMDALAKKTNDLHTEIAAHTGADQRHETDIYAIKKHLNLAT